MTQHPPSGTPVLIDSCRDDDSSPIYFCSRCGWPMKSTDGGGIATGDGDVVHADRELCAQQIKAELARRAKESPELLVPARLSHPADGRIYPIACPRGEDGWPNTCLTETSCCGGYEGDVVVGGKLHVICNERGTPAPKEG